MDTITTDYEKKALLLSERINDQANVFFKMVSHLSFKEEERNLLLSILHSAYSSGFFDGSMEASYPGVVLKAEEK